MQTKTKMVTNETKLRNDFDEKIQNQIQEITKRLERTESNLLEIDPKFDDVSLEIKRVKESFAQKFRKIDSQLSDQIKNYKSIEDNTSSQLGSLEDTLLDYCKLSVQSLEQRLSISVEEITQAMNQAQIIIDNARGIVNKKAGGNQ